jgi:hypothetical protein
MKRALCAVALLALACLLTRAARVGMAGDYVDPISKITAQDEALYAHSAIYMARNGQWLTPRFMGRLGLYKPPLLAWAAGLSARIGGVTRLSLRFPVALACSLALGLIFLWVAEIRSWQAGVCAAILLASSHLWHSLGSLCMTDGLLASFFIAGMYCLFADPWLESRAALWGLSASVAAAVLTKSVAGVLPLGTLGLYWLAAPRKYKPAFWRVCAAGLLALALASPWYIYQLLTHHRWFWTEHINVEILGFGAGAPPQTSVDSHLFFYLTRLVLLDPVLVAAALVAIPAFIGALRKRSPEAVLLACWSAVVLASVLGWGYRNAAYLLPLIPALAILSSSYGPVAHTKPAAWLLVLAAAVFVWKAMMPAAPWGVSFARGSVQPVAPIVSSYCQQERSNELIAVGVDDDFYASLLPLPRLRYALEGKPGVEGPYNMGFAQMGIIVTADQFDHLEQWMPVFRQRLREWGMNTGDPVGTLILAESPAQFADIVRAHPGTDFLFADRFREAVAPAAAATHVLVEAAPGHFFLLSRQSHMRSTPLPWSCWL